MGDGSITPNSMQAALSLCHIGLSCTPTEEIDVMQQAGIFPTTLATPHDETTDDGVDQWLHTPEAAMVIANAVAQAEQGSWQAAAAAAAASSAARTASQAAQDARQAAHAASMAALVVSMAPAIAEAVSAAAAAAAAPHPPALPPASPPPASPPAVPAGVPPCIEAEGVFVDKMGNRYSEDVQRSRIRKWALTSWPRPRGHALQKIKELWDKHGRDSFDVKDLHYWDSKNVERYPSAMGYCNGSELKGFPLFVPTRIVKGRKKSIIKGLRFYHLVAEQLEGLAKRDAPDAAHDGAHKKRRVATVQQV